MFDPTSRYARQPLGHFTDRDGRDRPFVALREVPPPVQPTADDLVHVVGDGDRSDRIAWQHLGDPLMFWRLCDENGVMHPDELTATIGRRLIVTIDGRKGHR